MLKIDKNIEDDVLTIVLEGRLDTNTSLELEKQLPNLYGINKIIFDMEKLEYMSSAGLRLILMLQKKIQLKGTIVIRKPNEEIKNVLDMSGFTKYFTIE